MLNVTVLSVFMLNVIILSGIMLNVIMLSVVILSAVAPILWLQQEMTKYLISIIF